MLRLYFCGLLYIVVFIGFGAIAATADELDRVSDYLEGMTTAEARFGQIADDGSRSSGTFSMQRPGRMRMEYDGRHAPLVIVGAGRVAIFDGKFRRDRPEQYPLSRTPLGPILARDVDLGRSPMVAGQRTDADLIHVWARDPQHPEYGTARFSFARSPLALKSWTMTNGAGETTHIEFGPMRIGGPIPPSRFSITHEVMKARRDR